MEDRGVPRMGVFSFFVFTLLHIVSAASTVSIKCLLAITRSAKGTICDGLAGMDGYENQGMGWISTEHNDKTMKLLHDLAL